MVTTYRVTHRTEYEYESEVSASYGQLHMLPRDLPGQRCRSAELKIDPVAQMYREHVDYFGNRVSFLAIHEPHVALTVTASSLVDVDERPDRASSFGHRSWQDALEAVRRGQVSDPVDATQYTLDSPLIAPSERYREYASASFTPGCSVLDAVASLSNRIHADFSYEPGSTSVATPLATVFDEGKGVCQDFAHLGIACLRSLGLPARYVSGYLETDPPPGRAKLDGVDGSHAWFSVLVPEAGWLDVDPTNDQFVNGRYIVTAYGRDYSDVPPMNGVIYTEGKTDSLNVAVDVVAVAE